MENDMTDIKTNIINGDLLSRIERDQPVTAQEIFDFAAERLLKQGKRSMRKMDGEDICAYRGRGGTACAVGHLIPDSLYLAKWDKITGTNVYALNTKGELPVSLRPHADMLSSMQDAHDDANSHFVPDFKRSMRYVAECFGLDSEAVAA
jgi:hypothetical protein